MIIALIGVIAIIGFLLSAAILLGLSKLFKVDKITYKGSLIITFLIGLLNLIITAILSIIGIFNISQILSVIIAFFLFNYIFKKYYLVSWKKTLGIYASSIVLEIMIALMIVVPIRLFVFEPFVVSGQSMSPHLNQGDYILINKFDHNFRRDDVVVFHSSNQAYLIKRVIGLPSEKIEIKNGQIFINGIQSQDPYLSNPISGNVNITLASDEYFVLSDSPLPSLDSRTFGPVKSSAIIGKIFSI